MPVNIHGKQYMTVAERVNDFRRDNPDYTLKTKLIQSDDVIVIMKAVIKNVDGRTIATGYAEERRGATQINRTSALENCETSAIGRALAAFGLGGTEYASANEVQNAIQQQDNRIDNTKPIRQAAVDGCYAMLKEEVDADFCQTKEEADHERMRAGVARLTPDEQIKVLDMFGKEKPTNPETGEVCRRMYKNIISDILKEKREAA